MLGNTIQLADPLANLDDRVDESTVLYRCALCGHQFRGLVLFDAHKVHELNSPLRRCLLPDELRALCFVRRKDGVWTSDILTSLHPNAAKRLATVRREVETGQPYADERFSGYDATPGTCGAVTTETARLYRSSTGKNDTSQATDSKARVQGQKKKSRRRKGRSPYTRRVLGE